ncbi:biotin transporter BioY [Sutcliffiella rhizosphaerae]|uniref:Biotin transporter n=1 Tax=Sutcliffiella rhizosphaerae TaxID=2880967 RepID=A0ABM8YM43_9BACI|nr:biotin transporter BioY [Sutcliffiella rhizosphaerae]CAG9621027.1 Biotin transporter BioY [Sutcliffiella rhizosphaerae]
MKRSFSALDITYVAMFVALMAIGANIVSWIPFLQIGHVPLSMQPFFCVLAGIILGSRLGAISMIVYLLVGMVGAPVYAGFGSGLAPIIGPTGGFLLSYVFTAYLSGLIVEKKAHPHMGTFMLSSFIGIILIYLIGTNYMYVILNYVLEIKTSYIAVWITMGWFSFKDFVFTIFCGLLATRLYYVVNKTARSNYSRKIA